MTTDTLPIWRSLADTDPEVAQAIRDEQHRQNDGLELIASENFVSRAVLEATGSVFTNKYAEGYPGKRYYGGCEYVDVVERAAIDRAKALFGAEHANVQPHSGAQANMAVYFTLLKPGDTVLGMNLAHGGHLTHGHPLNFSGKLYTIVPYGVRQRRRADRLRRARPPRATSTSRRSSSRGASAYPRGHRLRAHPRRSPTRVGAAVMTDMAHIAGLVAGGVHPSPVPHSDFVTTTTHKTLRGPRGGLVLCREQYAKDLDRTVFPGVQGGPLMHVIAAKAVCFKEAAEPAFARLPARRSLRQRARARRGARCARVPPRQRRHRQPPDARGRLLARHHRQGARKPRSARRAITVNKNAIPFDKNPPMVASGIRIGTPAVTTRGMREAEMQIVGELIARALQAPDDDRALGEVRAEVEGLCRKFPLYPDTQA